jgi:hypothetical protein
MIKQKKSGLLSGLWTFFEMSAPSDIDRINERKRKCFVIDEMQRLFAMDQVFNIEHIRLAGQVRTVKL